MEPGSCPAAYPFLASVSWLLIFVCKSHPDLLSSLSCSYADVIIPWWRGDNIVAIDLVTEHIKTKLQQHSLRRIYPNLEVIPSNYQIRGMHTIIRDQHTPKPDFTFFADRLNRLVSGAEAKLFKKLRKLMSFKGVSALDRVVL